MSPIPYPIHPAWRAELALWNERWQGGDTATPAEITEVLAQWRQRLDRPSRPDEEQFDIVDAAGNPLGITAPRWFCHLTGLRHRVVHVYFTSPQGLLLLQMRARNKDTWPLLFDTTVGGHLKAGQDWMDGVLSETEEELGLATAEIEVWLGSGLVRIGTPYERYDVKEGDLPIYNRQINQLYAGELSPWGLAHLRFADGEVAGIYLCHAEEARRMVEGNERVAPGLRGSFGRWWAWWENHL
ncbi:MAG: NUDIX domain-containing protein [Chloroflexi bacterium]|nr:NUDIX domain-containing protein [Chloroflexota bacterium]